MKLILLILMAFFFIGISTAALEVGYNDEDIGVNLATTTITNYSLVNVNNSLYWQGHTGTDGSWLTGVGITQHNLLSNLAWSVAGHTIDAVLNMNGFNIDNNPQVTSSTTTYDIFTQSIASSCSGTASCSNYYTNVVDCTLSGGADSCTSLGCSEINGGQVGFCHNFDGSDIGTCQSNGWCVWNSPSCDSAGNGMCGDINACNSFTNYCNFDGCSGGSCTDITEDPPCSTAFGSTCSWGGGTQTQCNIHPDYTNTNVLNSTYLISNQQYVSTTQGLLFTGCSAPGQFQNFCDSTGGINMLAGFNQPANRQLWVGDSDGLGNNVYTFFRYALASDGATYAIAAIDGVSGDGLNRREVSFGSDTVGVLASSYIKFNPDMILSYTGGLYPISNFTNDAGYLKNNTNANFINITAGNICYTNGTGCIVNSTWTYNQSDNMGNEQATKIGRAHV